MNVQWARRNDKEMYATYLEHPKTELLAEKIRARKKKYTRGARPQGTVVMKGSFYDEIREALFRSTDVDALARIAAKATRENKKFLISFQTSDGNDGIFFLNKSSIEGMRSIVDATTGDMDVEVSDYLRNFVMNRVRGFTIIEYQK